MTSSRFSLVVLAGLFSVAPSAAQLKEQPRVKEPPRAEKLEIQIRYRIRADRDERIRQYRVLEKHLASLGFDDAQKNDPEHELDIIDPTAERFRGTIPSAHVLEVLDDPRVQTILFAPAGYKYPEAGDQPVSIRITVRGGLSPIAQQVLHDQVLEHLERMGFQNALGYDTRRYTQLKGTIPYKILDQLVKDLRTEPAGWLLPNTPPDRLPPPIGSANPIRWVEVMPAVEPPPAFVPEVPAPSQATLTPDLRALLADPALKDTPVRVVILFSAPVEDRADQIRTLLASNFGPTVKRDATGNAIIDRDGQPALTDGATLDGVIGNLASILFDRPADVSRFAAVPGVISVRLPRAAAETITPLPADAISADAGQWLKNSGAATLHKLGYTGAGVKVLVVASDFSGAEKLIGAGLPRGTRIVDLTTELNPAITPSPSDPNRAGNGNGTALAVALAAPDAELVLVRIDPTAVFQLAGVLQMARGDSEMSQAMRSRLADITLRAAELNRRKEAAIAEYRAAFADLSDELAAKARRDRAKAALEAITAQQERLAQRTERFNVFQKEVLMRLAGARVIVNTLEWESGYPLDALSLLSRRLEQLAAATPRQVIRRAGDPAAAEKPTVLWVQAGSDQGAAVWGGAFLDANRNGTMEFAQTDRPLPTANWSPEMNFLGTRSSSGEISSEIAAGTKLRFTMQWREPLPPKLPSLERPAYPVILRVFRQLDPAGQTRPSDEMTESARSVGGPYPILLTDSYVVFEQILEFDAATAGRYALIVATGTQPPPLLPALRREVEAYPRIVIDTLSAKRGDPTVVFRSYTARDAGVGMPGDSFGVITVGTGTAAELVGGGTGITLRHKPDLMGLPTVAGGGQSLRGPGIATGFVGGIGAALVQTGAAGPNVFKSAGVIPGKAVIVPEVWLNQLRPAGKPAP
ncbi:MAG TPA: hypothetical protein VLM40_17505 [Gemmata sp.]|nr:hypothetical protein [Gemmata sp.]